MVNFRDPAVILLDEFALLKFWHVVDGIYIWEFLTNLGFEWSIIQGRRPYRWTIWIYALTRLSSLMTVIINLMLLNNVIIISCQVSAIFEMVPCYLAVSTASLLLVLRIIAIWEKNLVVAGLVAGIWCVGAAFLILGVSRFRQEWDDSTGSCTTTNFQSTKVTMIVAFVTDILLLIIMLAGLFRLGCHRQGSLATGRLLWNQGVVWIFLATVAGLAPTIFVSLDLNDALSMIFQIPWLLTMSMASAWMYRALQDLLSSDIPCPPSYITSHNIGCTISTSETRGTVPIPIPLNGVEMDAYTTVITHERSLTSQRSHNSLDRHADKLASDKPHAV